MKIRVRDRNLPLKSKTKKIRPLRLKNSILKWLLAVSLLGNIILGYLQYKS